MSTEAIAATTKTQAYRPRPIVPQGGEVVPAPKPVDSLQLSSGIFHLPGFAQGQSRKVEGKADGYNFTGSAKFNELSGRLIDLTLNASVFLFSAKVHLRFDAKPDGTVGVLAERTDSGKPEPLGISGQTLRVLSRKAHEMILVDTEGQKATFRTYPDGRALIEYGDVRIAFNG